MSHPSLMFIAGEASGDSHAAAVIKRLRAQAPELTIFGAGGPLMQAAGMELTLDLTEHAVVGLVEALKNYWKFRRIFLQLVKEVERRRPAAVVLVDFPGFNLRFAAFMKRRGIPVIYYISPQLWAWHASRARQIERDVDLMLTIFPFEKDWYAQHAPKLHVEYVGHPLTDRLADEPKAETRDPKLILLLAGSRDREVAKIFPVLSRVVDLLPPDYQFVAAAVNEQTAAMMYHPQIKVEIGSARKLMQRVALAIAASGTVTMEAAFYGCPMIVVYKVNWLTYLVGRAVVRVKWLAMPNVIAGRAILPEFIQSDAQPTAIADIASELLRNSARREQMQRDLEQVVASLGTMSASQRAAELILQQIRAA